MKKKIQIINSGDHYKEWLGKELIDLIESSTGLVIFTGGPDVPPEIYGEINIKSYCDIVRTNEEVKIYTEAIKNDIPVLGICYGSQLVTALQPKGKVIQNVTGHIGNHNILSDNGDMYEITSTHHQMMYPFNIPNHKIIAVSSENLSSEYICELGDYENIPNEPEIVYYPDTNTLAIQGHPEFDNCPEKTREYCRNLIKKYLFNKIS